MLSGRTSSYGLIALQVFLSRLFFAAVINSRQTNCFSIDPFNNNIQNWKRTAKVTLTIVFGGLVDCKICLIVFSLYGKFICVIGLSNDSKQFLLSETEHWKNSTTFIWQFKSTELNADLLPYVNFKGICKGYIFEMFFNILVYGGIDVCIFPFHKYNPNAIKSVLPFPVDGSWCFFSTVVSPVKVQFRLSRSLALLWPIVFQQLCLIILIK